MNFKNIFSKDSVGSSFLFFKENKKDIISQFIMVVVLAFIINLFVGLFISSPNFQTQQIITINSGDSLQKITNQLYDSGLIRSKFIFRSYTILRGGENKVKAGDYFVSRKQGTIFLSERFINGTFDLDDVRITIPEGWNVYQIADYLEKTLVRFNRNNFLDIAEKYEGYLFPDTYFVSPTIREKDLVEIMKRNFDLKISKIEGIEDDGRTLQEIITMASILEGEAKPKDRPLIAGILWKRISINMPLQVDTAFIYVNGKTTFDLTLEDLKIDSPYNTYRYKGLPPTPISNPGINSIIAAMNPEKTNYLYFLTGHDGVMYYAQTFDEHKKNKALYLSS